IEITALKKVLDSASLRRGMRKSNTFVSATSKAHLYGLSGLLCLLSCGEVSFRVSDKGFRYDFESQGCFDSDGKSGRNSGPMECGLIEDSDEYRKGSLKEQNLRGLK